MLLVEQWVDCVADEQRVASPRQVLERELIVLLGAALHVRALVFEPQTRQTQYPVLSVQWDVHNLADRTNYVSPQTYNINHLFQMKESYCRYFYNKVGRRTPVGFVRSSYVHSYDFWWVIREQNQIFPVVYVFRMHIFDKTLLLCNNTWWKHLTQLVNNNGQTCRGWGSLSLRYYPSPC